MHVLTDAVLIAVGILLVLSAIVYFLHRKNEPMPVNDLINKLGHLENNFTIGFHSVGMLATSHPDLFALPVKIGSQTLDSSKVRGMQSSQSTMQILIGEYSNALVRTLIRESTEAITTYANDTNQYSLIEHDDTFNFARIMRNSFSHNYVISYSQFYKRILASQSITWNGKLLTLAMEGDPLEKTFFGYEDAVLLFKDLKGICLSKLI